MELDADRCYRALRSRDGRFDGRFFVGVATTGVYCRPICPAPTPKRGNVRFFACAAAAEEAGFRPCRRCRPETSPGTPAWLGTSASVSRALRLIAEGALDRDDTERLAARLGLTARHLRRLFSTHLGASPLAVARTRRAHFARKLIDETDRPMTEVAFGAGFTSVRQFNQAVRETFHRTPTQLRRAVRRAPAPAGALEMRLPYRPPFDWPILLRFLRLHAIPRVESIRGTVYRRSIELSGSAGVLEVQPLSDAPELALRLWLPDSHDLIRVVERVRRVFDLGADPLPIGAQLAADRGLAPHLGAHPGLRVPGAWDAFELLVCHLAGPAPARVGRLVERFGTPLEAAERDGVTHVFPRPARLSDADLTGVGLPPRRADAIRRVAAAAASGRLALDGSRGLEDAVARLEAFAGIDDAAAHWIAMRAFGETDAFPADDRALRAAFSGARGRRVTPRELTRRAEAWRPWRAYAAIALLASARPLPPS